jgi:hypothetical protein
LAATATLAKDDLRQRPAASPQARPTGMRQWQIGNLAEVVHANCFMASRPKGPDE